ncbi:hypothetical protein [Streptomyces bauhiniae]|uniref:hypothetical protein n=1 Tax=Streptomyces bauhiniae TaxID=2340725 RepID=UPI00381A0B86
MADGLWEIVCGQVREQNVEHYRCGEGRPGTAARSSASNCTWPRCDPALRVLTQEWTSSSRAVLARFTGPEAAARLDALLEGMIMHTLLSTDREPRAEIRAAIVQTLGPVAGPGR